MQCDVWCKYSHVSRWKMQQINDGTHTAFNMITHWVQIKCKILSIYHSKIAYSCFIALHSSFTVWSSHALLIDCWQIFNSIIDILACFTSGIIYMHTHDIWFDRVQLLPIPKKWILKMQEKKRKLYISLCEPIKK